jgi:hypothetical protein
MTQQYLIGEMSQLIAELQSACPTSGGGEEFAVLRRRCEGRPLVALSGIAADAVLLDDRICWDLLTTGDVASFGQFAAAAANLCEFTASACLTG